MSARIVLKGKISIIIGIYTQTYINTVALKLI